METSRPANFDSWELFTQTPIYQGQLKPVGSLIRGTVLDVASNYGRFSSLSTTSVSVDSERRFLRRGVELGNIKHPLVASALCLPFRNHAFDTVLAMGIIDHIPMKLTPVFLDELTRVAKETGTVLIQVTSPYCLFAMERQKSYGDYEHAYSPFRLRRQLRERGWETSAVLSSGLVGQMTVSTRTVSAFVPWAVHVTLAFRRRVW